ncbi:NAD(P)-dependent oxidoreductase [Microbacterium pullorum]|uniref:NAD(P)-dependent oxidoreductase n=1 Tax=Microbacterium pullorum TaxID=2762236 RepID=UPI003850BBCE
MTVLGGTGRTGRLLVDELLSRGHALTLLGRDPAKAAAASDQVTLVAGDTRDRDAVARAVAGADVVVSALGPVGKDTTLLRDTAGILIPAMSTAGVSRYVGISVAGLDLPGDRKRGRDKIISWLLNRLGGELAQDKILEHAAWETSPLEWTLVRVPRLVDGPAGPVEHDPHRSGRRTSLTRASLARFLADATENATAYPRQAPFVADK